MSMYFDNASTTQVKPEVIEAMMPYFTEKFYNPSALYSKATKIKEDIEQARKIIGDFINADGNDIYFTSSGSESNNWAVQGFVNYWNRKGQEPIVITSVIEHKSILACVDHMMADVHYIGVDSEGYVNIENLKNLLNYLTRSVQTPIHRILVSIQFANNEIGTIQHIKEIAEIVHNYNAVFHTDAVQAFGQTPIDVKELGIDMLSASGHKIGCPKGIGMLYKKHDIEVDPFVYGSQMDGMRGGTENVPYIVGMAKAVELIGDNTKQQMRLNILRNNFITELKSLGCKVNGSLTERLPNNINVTFSQNISGESLVYLLDMAGVYISTGSACDSHSIEPSHILTAIGLSDEEAAKTIRITLGDDTTIDDVNMFISELKKQVALLAT